MNSNIKQDGKRSDAALPAPRLLRHWEAKSCPFCGASPTIEPSGLGGPLKRLVGCGNDFCAVSPAVTGGTRARALAKWNTRDGIAP